MVYLSAWLADHTSVSINRTIVLKHLRLDTQNLIPQSLETLAAL